MRHAKDLGHPPALDICNVPESAIECEYALRFIARAGPEIGVAPTRGFTTQVAALFLLILVIGKLRGRISTNGLSTTTWPACATCPSPACWN